MGSSWLHWAGSGKGCGAPGLVAVPLLAIVHQLAAAVVVQFNDRLRHRPIIGSASRTGSTVLSHRSPEQQHNRRTCENIACSCGPMLCGTTRKTFSAAAAAPCPVLGRLVIGLLPRHALGGWRRCIGLARAQLSCRAAGAGGEGFAMEWQPGQEGRASQWNTATMPENASVPLRGAGCAPAPCATISTRCRPNGRPIPGQGGPAPNGHTPNPTD